MTEEERKRVYEMCRVLGMVFEVWKDGVFMGVYRIEGDKIIKTKITEPLTLSNNKLR